MADDSWGRGPYGRPSFNASVLSMMHLEPSPMESLAASTIDEKDEESLAESTHSNRSLGSAPTSTLGLHDSSRGTIFWCKCSSGGKSSGVAGEGE